MNELVELRAKVSALEELLSVHELTVLEQSRELEAALKVAQVESRAKSLFLASMSHELRTPLNSIIGFSEILSDEAFGDLNKKQTRYIRNVLESGRHLLKLINDLLDHSKIEAGHLELNKERLNLTVLAERTFQRLTSLAEPKGIEMTFQSESPAFIVADASRIEQVLYNLYGNALKFTPNGGQVSVLIEARAEDKVAIVVQDSGIGIKPENVQRIFRLFERGHSPSEHEGTGMGLALALRLVEAHGGTLTAESPGEGKGSRFTVLLPADVVESAPDGRSSVLVIDDDEHAREILTLHLEQAGYSVLTAINGQDGLRLAREARPAAITLDVRMPGLGGWEVLRILKEDPDLNQTPVIMVTGSGDEMIADRAGACQFLRKPVEAEVFLDTVRRQIGKPRGRLLLIDDDPLLCELMEDVLSKRGYTVISCQDGLLGLREAVMQKPDAIIVDLEMPELDGHEVIRRLREDSRTDKIPILIFSSCDPSRLARIGVEAKADAVASKSDIGKLVEHLATFV